MTNWQVSFFNNLGMIYMDGYCLAIEILAAGGKHGCGKPNQKFDLNEWDYFQGRTTYMLLYLAKDILLISGCFHDGGGLTSSGRFLLHFPYSVTT